MDGATEVISPPDLFDLLNGASPPLIFDVRRAPAFAADSHMLASAERGAPDEVAEWARQIPPNQPVVGYCVYGHEVSQGAAAALREIGIDARYLAGGIKGWTELGLPLRPKTNSERSPESRDQAP